MLGLNLGLNLGSGVVSAAFTPASLSGLTLWLDASDTNTLWEDTSATTPATTVVGRWDDKSGNGYNATQATGANQPTLGTSINGLDSLTFNGTTNTMALPSGLYSVPNGDYTIFVVSKKATTSSMVSIGGNSSGGDFFVGNTSSSLFIAGGGASSYQYNSVGTDLAIYGATQDSISRDLFVNGQRNFANKAQPVLVDSLYIGVNPPNIWYFNGQIAEVIWYNRALSLTEQNNVGLYLAGKWGATWEDFHTDTNLISAATTNYTPENKTSLTYTNMVNYVPFYIPYDMDYLVLSDNTWWHTATSTGGLGNTLTVVERSVVSEDLGYGVQVTWDGNNSVTIKDGYADRHSDKIYPSSFGLSKFSAGTILYIKSIESVPIAGNYYPITGPYTVSAIGLNTQTATYDPAVTTPSSVLESGKFTVTGTALTNLTYAYRPFVLGKPSVSGQKSIMGLGDSITYGSGDTSVTNIHRWGYFQRAIQQGGNYLASINNGRNSITAANTNIFTYWRFFLRYSNIAVVALGTNDMSGAVSAATLQARLQDTWSIIRQSRVSNIIELPLITKASSTDGYLTTINQTIDTNWLTVPDEVNTWLDTKVADNTIEAVIDRSGIVDSVEPYKWGVDGVTTHLYNSDTVHPNANGCVVLGTATRSALDAL